MEFRARLKSIRLSHNLTQLELANRANVSITAVRYWENGGRTPTMNAVIALAAALNVSTDTLLGVEPSSKDALSLLPDDERNLVQSFRSLDSISKNIVLTLCQLEEERMGSHTLKSSREKYKGDRYIPLYLNPSAAGSSAPNDESEFELILVDDKTPSAADYAVKIAGNSMEPYISDKDIVFVKRCTELYNGDVGIFNVDGAMYCKQYYRDDDELTLVSANPEFANTNVHLSPDGNQSAVICGKVLLEHKLELPQYLFN